MEEEGEQPESDASGDEEAMEVDGKAAKTEGAVVQKLSKKAASGGAQRAAASPRFAVSSGLPQSTGELEALIKAIHHTVSSSVLPRLHKCLTAKVQSTHLLSY